MSGNFGFAHNATRQRFANLYMIFSNLVQIEHRIKRRRFPNVSYFQIEKLRQKIHAWIIEITAFALNHEQQRNQRGTLSCRIMGEPDITQHICDKLGIHVGETTEDEKFTVSRVECLGSCGTAPMMQINFDYHEDLTNEKVDKILDSLK